MTRDGLLAGVDIGGSKISVLISDADLNVQGRLTRPTSGHDSDGVVDRIVEIIEEVSPGRLAAVGVGFPGIVQAHTGTVSRAANLHWEELQLGEQLSTRLGAPVWVENDVRAAAAAIHELGLAGERRSFAYLSVGTGIGTGVVLGGKLWRGEHGLAGEIGHVVIRPDGPLCSCGLRGCLEAVAAGPAIARAAQEALDAGQDSTLAAHRPVTAKHVFAAAAEGDGLARRLVDHAGDDLAWAVHVLVMTYDVEVVLIGGGLAEAGSHLLEPLLRGIERRRQDSQLAAEILKSGIVELLATDAEPGTWGALLLARRGLEAPSDQSGQGIGWGL